MGHIHQMLPKGYHAYEVMRNGMAGGVVCPTNASVTAAFGGFGLSTATATTNTGAGVETTTTTATANGEATVTWRTDIAGTAVPVVLAMRSVPTTVNEAYIRAVHVAGVGPTSCAVWMQDQTATNHLATANGTAQVMVFGEFTGTQVT